MGNASPSCTPLDQRRPPTPTATGKRRYRPVLSRREDLEQVVQVASPLVTSVTENMVAVMEGRGKRQSTELFAEVGTAVVQSILQVISEGASLRTCLNGALLAATLPGAARMRPPSSPEPPDGASRSGSPAAGRAAGPRRSQGLLGLRSSPLRADHLAGPLGGVRRAGRLAVRLPPAVGPATCAAAQAGDAGDQGSCRAACEPGKAVHAREF